MIEMKAMMMRMTMMICVTVDEDGLSIRRKTLGDGERVPWVDRSIGEDDPGDLDPEATVVGVGEVYGCGERLFVDCRSVDISALLGPKPAN